MMGIQSPAAHENQFMVPSLRPVTSNPQARFSAQYSGNVSTLLIFSNKNCIYHTMNMYQSTRQMKEKYIPAVHELFNKIILYCWCNKGSYRLTPKILSL
jgi:hypothetical protein